jgi:tetratricopeptide (TPR) repeat protein
MEGRCASYGQSLPYGPFRELLREWLGTSPQQPELRTRVALRRQVEALFGEGEVRLQPLLASVLGLPLEREASEVLAHLAPDSLQTAVFDAVASLVRRLAGDGPVVVAIDDVHWADPTSVQLMDHLMATTETDAVLLVAVGRPERDHPSWSLRHVAAQRFGHRAHDIVLEPLTGEADARMLESLLGDATLPAKVAERLLGVAEGNPFFIEELVRFLVEAGTLVQTTDGWRWDGDTAVEVPQTVERVLVTRIDRLSPRSRDVLSAASVVGRQFAVELVEAVSDPGTDVAAAFSELQRLDLIREVRRWPRREYRFKHALVQEAAYGTLVDDWRRELHRRAAHGIEMLVPDRVAESYALLAHHCARAGEIPRAMAYFRLAGDGATQMNAVEEAIGHYSAGVGLETSAVGRHDQATMAALHLGRGRLLWQRGDQRAEEDFESALRASRETGDRTTELAALEGIGLVAAFLHGRRTEAIGRFEHAFALARACGDDSAAVTFANRLTIESVHRLELDRALDWGEEARACADRAGTDRALARALDGRKLVAAALGDLPMLGALTRRLERILRAQNDLWYLKHALAESSLEAAGRGRFAESSDRLTEALDINDRLGNQVDRSYFLTLQAWVERSRGAYGLALRLAREAVALADENPRGLWQAWSEANLGVIHLELGSPTQAIAHFDRGRQAADRAGVGMQYVRCCSHLAWVYWTIGDERRSAESLEQADHLLSEVRVPAGKAWLQGVDAYLSVARTHQARGDGHRGVKLLRPLLVPARESGWYEAISSVALGLSASSASDVGELLLREALRSAELGGVKPLEWQCHHALGEALRVGGRLDEAVMHTNRALQIRCALAGSLADPVFSRELLADQPPPAR